MSDNSSSSSTTTSSLFSSNRYGGLATGLDTDSLVKAMASGTKSRINKQQQKLDTLKWKQESYRSVISKIQSFQSTFLDSLNKSTCVKLPSLFKTYSASSNNSKVTATTSSGSSSSSYSISSIQQLAKNAEISSSDTGITTGAKINLDNLDGVTEYSVSVSLDGQYKDISFKSKEDFMNALDESFGEGTFEYSNGNLSCTKNDGISHSYIIQAAKNTYKDLPSSERIEKQTASLKAIGIDGDGVSNKARLLTKLSEMNLSKELTGESFSFEINGESFSFDKNASIKDIVNTVNDSDAGVTMSFDTLSQKFTIKSDEEGSNAVIEMKQTGGNLLSALGFNIETGGISSSSIKKNSVSGGVDQSVELNSLKTAGFKLDVNGSEVSLFVPVADKNGTAYDFVDDEDMTAEGAKTAGEKLAAALNQSVNNSSLKGKVTFAYDKDAKAMTVTGTNAHDTVKITSDGSEKSVDFMNAMGYDAVNGSTNKLSENTLAADLLGAGTFKVGDTEISISDGTTLGEIKSALESSGVGTLDLESGILTAKKAITADTDEGKALAEHIFGASYDKLSNPANYPTGASSLSAQGQNAILTVNGTTISNSSNSVEIDGTTINLSGLSDADAQAVSALNPITVTTERDTSAAFDAIVKFVDNYNSLIEDLNKEIDTSRPKSNKAYYDPLTEEQRKEMSDKEIEDWEEKAKTGLLYQDRTINDFLSKLRSAMGTVSPTGMSLDSLGITESTNWKDNGKLIIDSEALKKALAEKPDEISDFFTNTSTGLATNVQNTIDKAVSTSRVKGYGSLTLVAGVENTASASKNTISEQIESYQEIIDRLKTRYQSELDRYWANFTNLETYTSKYSSISSMFSA